MKVTQGRAIAQAVSRWLPIAAARVWQLGFVVDKMAPGQVFTEYFGFPCQPHFIPPTSPSSQSPGTGQYMAAVPRGHPIWIPAPTIRIKKKLIKVTHNFYFGRFRLVRGSEFHDP
jgi:hypothetical protein